jgi:hypothetical protein
MTTQAPAQPETANESPRRILCRMAPHVVRTLYELGERTWPQTSRPAPPGRFSFATAKPTIAPLFRVIMRRKDLGTLQESWRLECGGPVEFFEWDDSGAIRGSYGVRYPVYSVMPVFDESGQWSGFGLNSRRAGTEHMQALDARVDCAAFVRSTNPEELVAGLRSLAGKPRIEEIRPGVSPTSEYIDLMLSANRRSYFTNRGVNQYIGPLWTPESLDHVFDEPEVRAVWIAHPDRPGATPKPEKH